MRGLYLLIPVAFVVSTLLTRFGSLAPGRRISLRRRRTAAAPPDRTSGAPPAGMAG